jgi:virginiamycin A acetyltransferase
MRKVRELVKAAARGAATVAVAPLLLSYYARSALLGRDRALEGSTQALALLPGLLGQYLRRAFLMRVLAAYDPTAVVEFGTIFSSARARIGRDAYVGPRCHVGLAEIGAGALIAGGVHIPSGAHIHGIADPSAPIREQHGNARCVRIGADAWIGAAAVVMADVGAHTIVGAGAVVTRPLPPGVVAAGVPARIVRERRATTVRSA